jgi:hypothetical protein
MAAAALANRTLASSELRSTNFTASVPQKMSPAAVVSTIWTGKAGTKKHAQQGWARFLPVILKIDRLSPLRRRPHVDVLVSCNRQSVQRTLAA